MVVTGTYGTADVDISTATVTGWQASHATIPSSQGTGNLTVTITATDSSGNTAETTVTIGTIKKLTGLTITTAPTATQTYGSAASKSGAIGRATYSDGSTANIEASSLTLESPTGNWGVVGSQTMTLGYTETTSFTGSTTKYTADTTVTVNKAAQSITLNPTSVSINASNYSSGVAVSVTRLGDGAVSVSGSVTGLTATVSGTTVTVKGNGSTATSTTFTVRVAEGTYYLAGAATFTATAEYWSFGAGNGEAADAAWFAGLKNYLATHSGASLTKSGGGSIVGATKTVTLTSAVLGTTSHQIVVIGVDQDADNTVTWQTLNSLGTTSTFSSLSSDSSNYARGINYHDSANLIYDGNASGACKAYYNAFPGKASIKQLNKGTCVTQVSGRNGTATYQNQYVWIPSEGEVGLDSQASLGYSNWTTTNGECTYGKKFQYSYYTDNSKRIKKTGDAGSAYYWWARGHYYSNAIYVCAVFSDGSADGDIYWNSSGVAPAFCIGN